MRAVELDRVESRLPGAPRRIAVVEDQGVHAGFRERDRRRPPVVERDREGGDDRPPLFPPRRGVLRAERGAAVPWSLRGAFRTAVADLDPGGAAETVQEIDDTAEGLHVGVEPEPEAPMRDAPVPAHRRRLHQRKTRPPHGEAPELDEVQVVGYALDRAVHRHGGNDDAVLQRHGAQRQRLEQHRPRAGVFRRSGRFHAILSSRRLPFQSPPYRSSTESPPR